MPETKVDHGQAERDVLRAVVMSAVTSEMLSYVLNAKLPKNLNSNILSQTAGQLQRMEREVRKAIGPSHSYLDKHIRPEKLYNLIGIIDLMDKIAIEESQQLYDKFTDLVVDCLHAVLYAQKQRKSLHIGKYMALFKLFTDEVRADSNGVPGQVMYSHGELYLRTNKIPEESKIK